MLRILLSLCLLVSFGSLRAQPLNTLSAQEKKDGWQLLFNGRTTAGWHTYGGKGVGSAWKVEQGALHLDVPVRAGNKAPNGGDLVTDAEIKGDFEVKIEWKVGHLTNSGIFFFVQEQPSYKNVYDTGLELQLEDAPARTRLYRIGIANNLHDIEQDFDVLGLTDLIEWEPFRKNADYLAFSIRRKF